MFSYVSGIAGKKTHSTKESSKIWTKRTQSSLTMPSSEKLSKVTLFFLKKISLEKIQSGYDMDGDGEISTREFKIVMKR